MAVGLARRLGAAVHGGDGGMIVYPLTAGEARVLRWASWAVRIAAAGVLALMAILTVLG